MKIFAVCMIGLFLSLVIAFIGYSAYGVSAFYSNDSYSYAGLAKGIIENGTFGSPAAPEFFITPGYPLFLVPFMFLFENWEWIVVAAQILISCGTALITYKIACEFTNKSTALFSVMLFALSPLIFISNTKIMTETLFTFLLSIFIFSFVKFLKNRNLISVVISAISLTAATFVRPVSIYLIYVSVAFLLVYCLFSKTGLLRGAKIILIFALIAVSPIKMWEHRNFTSTGFEGFSSASGVLLYFHNVAALLAKQEGIPYQQKTAQMGYPDIERYFDTHPEQKNLSRGALYSHIEDEAKSIIKNNFFAYIPIHLKGIFITLGMPGIVDWFMTMSIYPSNIGLMRKIVDIGWVAGLKELLEKYLFATVISLLALLGLIVYYSLAAVGFWTHIKKSANWETVFVILILFYMLAVSGGPGAVARYRIPITFIIAIFAGIGLDRLITRKTTTSRDNILGKG